MKTHRTLACRLVLAAIAAGAASSLGGCAVMDPYARPGVWRPMGSNDLNRELQVARPTDLVQGRGTTDYDGQTAANAVDRMLRDKVKALQDTDISSVGSSGTSSSSGSGS
jgi:type IV pilus biogenesis protein CpaD/CtpE